MKSYSHRCEFVKHQIPYAAKIGFTDACLILRQIVVVRIPRDSLKRPCLNLLREVREGAGSQVARGGLCIAWGRERMRAGVRTGRALHLYVALDTGQHAKYSVGRTHCYIAWWCSVAIQPTSAGAVLLAAAASQ